MDKLSIINLISFGALASCIVFSILIIVQKQENKKYKLFSIFLMSIGVILFFFLLLDFEKEKLALFGLPIFMSAVLSLGPILWIYIKSVIGEGSKLLRRHFLLPGIYFLITLILIGLQHILKEGPFLNVVTSSLLYSVILGLSVIFLLQSGYYIVKSVKLYRFHLLMISNTYSYTEKINLSWLKVLIYGYVFFIVGLVLAHLVEDAWSSYFFYLTILVYVVFIGYNALIQEPLETFEDASKKEDKLSKIDISNEFFKDLKVRLVSSMIEDKIFLKSGLNIHDLAAVLNTNSKYVSTLINQEFKVNFVTFINKYRIDEAKILLLDPKKNNVTIEAIGNESGFKSKSAFNVAFKKETGITPSMYVKESRQKGFEKL